jgi:hypothetical protein
MRCVPGTVCTDVTPPLIARALRTRVAFWTLAGVALLAAHDAIYLAQIGPGGALADALRTAGHGYWGWASLGLTSLAVIAGVVALARIRRLRRKASALGTTRGSAGPLVRRVGIAWLRLFAVVTLGFTLQENVEHLIAHGHALGAEAVLGPERPLALPVIGLIAGLAAVIAAVIAGAHESLVVGIEAALRRLIRPSRTGRRPVARLAVVIGPILSRRGAGRAPPALVDSAS